VKLATKPDGSAWLWFAIVRANPGEEERILIKYDIRVSQSLTECEVNGFVDPRLKLSKKDQFGGEVSPLPRFLRVT